MRHPLRLMLFLILPLAAEVLACDQSSSAAPAASQSPDAKNSPTAPSANQPRTDNAPVTSGALSSHRVPPRTAVWFM